MNLRDLTLVVFLFGLFANQARAQGTISYTGDYPKTSTGVGKAIAIKGSITLDKGWTIKKIQFKYWVDGKKVQFIAIAKYNANYQWYTDDCGNWIPVDMTVGQSKVYFNVVVEATLNDGTNDVVIATRGYRIQSSN